MPRSEKQKQKLLYLTKIFREETDENHGLTMPEIIERLGKYGISAERKALYTDFEELRDFGLDITSETVGNRTFYKLVSREFELAELKLLVDSVLSAKFITERKSAQLVKKLEGLVSRYEAKQLHRQVLISGRVKTMNESIYYNIDKLHTAINAGVQIEFKYFRWNTDKKEEYRRNGAVYRISPWHLRWDDENYYLIGYDSASDTLKHYRVDKMRSIRVTDMPRDGKKLMESFDAAVYTKSLFGMYGGEEKRVTLVGSDDMVGIIIDRFGKDVPVIKNGNGTFTTYVDVTVSPQFYGWVASLGGKLTVTAPESVVEGMRNLVETLHSRYR